MAIQRETIVLHAAGLHARPAALFVKKASEFQSRIDVKNLTQDGPLVDAKSILSLLTCGVSQNDRISISAEGADEWDAVSSLVDLVENNFEEH